MDALQISYMNDIPYLAKLTNMQQSLYVKSLKQVINADIYYIRLF